MNLTGNFVSSSNRKPGARLLRLILRKKFWTYQHRKHGEDGGERRKKKTKKSSLNEVREQIYVRE